MNYEDIQVVNNVEASRFEVRDGDLVAVIEYKMKDEHTIAFIHTGVPEEMSGHGVASRMARAALDYARDADLRVIPICPFVAGYIHKHPEYQDLVGPRAKQAS